MPRRATSTSFGAENGNDATRGGRPPGISPERFRHAMAWRAAREATVARMDQALKSSDDKDFLAAFRECADRGFGKAVQAVDVTSTGALLPAAEREARVRAIVEAVLARGEGRVGPATAVARLAAGEKSETTGEP